MTNSDGAPSSSNSGWERVLLAVATIVLPSGAIGVFWDIFRDNPLWIIPALMVGVLVVLGAGVVVSAIMRLRERLVEIVNDRIDGLFRRERAEYLRRLSKHIEDIELAGVATTTGFAVGLTDVYVDVSLLRTREQDSVKTSLVTMPKTSIDRQPFETALRYSKSGVAAVVGGPGSGKTTMLRHTALRLCQQSRRRQQVPIVLELRNHLMSINLRESLPAMAASVTWLEGKTSAQWFENILDHRNAIVMLDGLDEVGPATTRAKVVEWVKNQVARYPGNTFVVTSRPYGYESNPISKADLWQMRKLTQDQVKEFLKRWYGATEQRLKKPNETFDDAQRRSDQRATDLVGKLHENPALLELASNPLLLTMIALVHFHRGALPGSRVKLYEELCDLLLHRRRDHIGLNGDSEIRGDKKEVVAWKLATHMMIHGSPILVTKACEAIAETLRATAPTMTPEAFMDDLSQNGLIVSPEHDMYGFAHLSLQEYLVASSCLKNRDSELLVEHVNDPSWREVTLLWAAQTDATPVVEACLTSGTVEALTLAFECAEQARQLDVDSRNALEVILSGPAVNDEHYQLMTSVKVFRNLRQTIVLENESLLGIEPVSVEVYELFLQAQLAEGFAHPEVADDAGSVLLWSEDVTAFLAWANKAWAHDGILRLPRAHEWSETVTGTVFPWVKKRVWIEVDAEPRLMSFDLRHPAHKARPKAVAEGLLADRQRTGSAALAMLYFLLESGLERPLNEESHKVLSAAFRAVRDLEIGLDLDRALGKMYGSGEKSTAEIDKRKVDESAVWDFASYVKISWERDMGLAQVLASTKLPSLTDWDPDLLRVIVVSYLLHVGCWSPSPRAIRKGQLLESFDEYLRDVVDDVSSPDSSRVSDILEMVSQALLDMRMIGISNVEDSRHRLGRIILVLAESLLRPVAQRLVAADEQRLSTVRFALAAVMALQHDSGERLEWHVDTVAEIVANLHGAIGGITAMQQRAAGQHDVPEALFLVRD